MKIQKKIFLVTLLMISSTIKPGRVVANPWLNAYELYNKNPSATPFKTGLTPQEFITQLQTSMQKSHASGLNAAIIEEDPVVYMEILMQDKKSQLKKQSLPQQPSKADILTSINALDTKIDNIATQLEILTTKLNTK